MSSLLQLFNTRLYLFQYYFNKLGKERNNKNIMLSHIFTFNFTSTQIKDQFFVFYFRFDNGVCCSITTHSHTENGVLYEVALDYSDVLCYVKKTHTG